ncbi:hypothetical protein O6H91_01G106600 [Diphasiastrum complanatum]|uniref:Uncharacterized protein n=1 Tax=Diphasiastrum complanatum TaxID=34168 RepID=A0ACC2EUD5_DIPCM|nr:hypothetical protein O6H91_01G106600 [Diphasiastrum complanatum]
MSDMVSIAASVGLQACVISLHTRAAPIFSYPSLHFKHFLHIGATVSRSSSSTRRRRRCSSGSKSKHDPFAQVKASASDTRSSSHPVDATTAEEAINVGLSLFSKGRFNVALELNPTPEEAQAALYNKACCHSYREEGEQAAQTLRIALRQYNLKFSTILNDPDMAPFRSMPEFKQLQNEARAGGQEIGNSFRRDLKLISEVQAPFRGIRKVLYAVFSVAAGISTLFTIPRFLLAFQGGEGAPDKLETAQNLAINVGGIVVLVTLYIWDSKKEEEEMLQITRNETLSRLPVRLATNRIVELAQLREFTRPVILAGKKDTITRAVQRSEKYRRELQERGVLVIPLIWSDKKEELVKKKGFGILRKSSQDDFDKRADDIASRAVIQSEKKFLADVVSQKEWESWIQEQQESKGLKPGEDVFIVLRLDGRVRKSGQGMPDWAELVNELPRLDSLVSKLEK